MNDTHLLYRAVLANPGEDTPLLALTDRFDELGEHRRAEAVRRLMGYHWLTVGPGHISHLVPRDSPVDPINTAIRLASVWIFRGQPDWGWAAFPWSAASNSREPSREWAMRSAFACLLKVVVLAPDPLIMFGPPLRTGQPVTAD